MAAVTLEGRVHTDPRYKILAKLSGITKGDAIYKMVLLWDYCTEHETYFIDDITIDTIAEIENFHRKLLDVRVQLAEMFHGKIRIKGTKGRIEWLAKKRKNGKKGGRPRKPKANLSVTETKPIGLILNNPSATVTAIATSSATAKKPIIYSPEFLKFWEAYPKHIGKGRALKAFVAGVRNVLEFEQLDYALRNYLQYCKLNNRFYKDPTTFLNQWREWLEPEVPLDMSEEDAQRFGFLKDSKVRDVSDTP